MQKHFNTWNYKIDGYVSSERLLLTRSYFSVVLLSSLQDSIYVSFWIPPGEVPGNKIWMTVGCIEVSKAGNDFKLLLKYGVSKFAPISELRKKLIVVQVWSTLCDLADMASSSFCKLCRKGATRKDLVSLPSLLTSSISYFRATNDLWGQQVELEQVPCPARLKAQAWWKACSKPITRYYPGLNLGQACELFDKLNRAWKNVE